MAYNSWPRILFLYLLLLLHCRRYAATPNRRIIYRFTDCNAEQLQHLPKVSAIYELSAVTCNISTLPNAYFTRFTSLSALEVRESGLAKIGDYALNGLEQLQWLVLPWNYITNIRPWSQTPLKALHTLDLEGNAVKTLSAESFMRYPNLHYLSLAHNMLERISNDAFTHLPHLRQLNLAHNRIAVIESLYFRGMQHLAHLSLQHNAIERVAADSFETNAHLRSLRLDGNKLRDLDFLRSKHLNLSSNALHLLAASCLDKLINLEAIDLSANNLTQLHIGLFDAPTQLQRVNLSRNALSTIHADFFAQLPYLRALDMSGNQLSSGAFIAHLSPLLPHSALTLDLSENHLTQLDVDAMAALQVCGASVDLSANRWHCQWLIVELVRAPAHVHFGRNYSLASSWSVALLNVSGIDCYDAERQRSIVVLDAGRLWERRHSVGDVECTTFVDPVMPTPPPLVWPRVRVDRFDSRSIIIWMLIAIGLAFTGLRIARQLIDRREQTKRVKKLLEMKTQELTRLTVKNVERNNERT
nr:insulin-like growth factor-binding protein complex acid labile subunit [Bactrocera oleae]